MTTARYRIAAKNASRIFVVRRNRKVPTAMPTISRFGIRK